MARKFAFNTLYIIDILGENDLYLPKEIEINTNRGCEISLNNNTASQLFKSVSSLNLPIPVYFVKIHNRPMLHSFFKDLEVVVREKSLIPILHFECHGSSEDGVFLPTIKKYVSWSEINEFLLKINKLINNNILVAIAGCQSYKLIDSIEYSKGSPFGCYVGANSVTHDGIIKRFKDFYRHIFLYNDFEAACEILGNDFSVIFSYDICMREVLLPIVLNYFGKDRKDLVEYTVNQMIANGQQGPISYIRKIAKSRLKNLGKYYEVSGKRFLHGNKPLPFSELERIALTLKASLNDEAKFNEELKAAIQFKKQLFIGKGNK
ncbi:hypothetical protein [Citrobacter amalonaticus]|uniref:hypothetical protein n=1 Tax=Citrobacter amalonaticus TaxID=35703 RepID=UPI0031F2DBA9